MKQKCSITRGLSLAVILAAGGISLPAFGQGSDTALDAETVLMRATSGEEQTPVVNLGTGFAPETGLERVEALTSGDTNNLADQLYGYASGSFGEIRFGRTPGASDLLGVRAPSAAGSRGLFSEDFVDLAGTGLAPGGTGLGGFGGQSSLSGDADKIVYFTPRFAGLQLGASYTREIEGADPASLAGMGSADIMEFGANYATELYGVNLALSGTYMQGEPDPALALTTPLAGARNAYGFGASVGYAGFSLGASWSQDGFSPAGGDSLTLANGGAWEAWQLALMYDAGAWAVSLGFGEAEQQATDFSTGAPFGRDNIDLYELSASYSLLPWLDLSTGLQWYDFEAEALLSGAGGSGDTDDAAVVFVGTAVRF